MEKAISPINNEVRGESMDVLAMYTKRQGAVKVYQKNEYIILKVKRGYIVYNTKKPFENGHTHLHSFEMSKTLIDNSIRKKRPKTNNLYLLESHSRVTNDSKYKKILEEILNAKNNKTKEKYYNKRCI